VYFKKVVYCETKGAKRKAKSWANLAALRLLYQSLLQPPAGQLLAFGVLGVALGVADASPATFFLAPLLKSVSYQPVPFNLNPAAEIFFINSGFVQAGQIRMGSAPSFCNASCS
jgi:hypothetical protein